DGIGVREIPPCERLVHDYRLGRVGPVSTVERPSREERRPHHSEVVAADFVEVRVAVLHRTARDDASVPITAVERHDQCLGGVANAGAPLEPRHGGSEGARARRETWSAGPSPNSTHVRTVTETMNANTRKSGVRPTKIPPPRAFKNITSAWPIQRASSSPPTAPNPASTTLSDSI